MKITIILTENSLRLASQIIQERILQEMSTASGQDMNFDKESVIILSVGSNGYTLFNGIHTINRDGRIYNSAIVKEIIKRKVTILYCLDEYTYIKRLDVWQSYSCLLENLKVKILEAFTAIECKFCKIKNCHRGKMATKMSLSDNTIMYNHH